MRTLVALLATSLALAQAPAPTPTAAPTAASAASGLEASSPQQIFAIAVAGAEGMVVGAAEAMPEDRFGFVPAGGDFKGVRTFAELVKHVASANYMAAERISGLKPPLDVAQTLPTLKSKAELVQLLKDSFAFARKAVAGVKDEGLYEQVPSPFGPGTVPRMLLFFIPVAHSVDHYGQMVIYLRHNGIVPPASRK
ncbi:MAG: DinB family protein [Holophagaceae bacterium]|nr:DinB family protein [Holophagaceae bacterium]